MHTAVLALFTVYAHHSISAMYRICTQTYCNLCMVHMYSVHILFSHFITAYACVHNRFCAWTPFAAVYTPYRCIFVYSTGRTTHSYVYCISLSLVYGAIKCKNPRDLSRVSEILKLVSSRGCRLTRNVPPWMLKEQSIEIFDLRFFQGWTPPSPLTRYFKTFRIWLLFIAESWFSLICLLRRVATLRIVLARCHHLLELSA
jgi:hypothetical protein